ncbi:hypothetical protein B0H13DRAFT_1953408 [Mycena leptocephala]|nr:hypothetical protein B0H13DRAFT_1953408 [Mycena leptocephala]
MCDPAASINSEAGILFRQGRYAEAVERYNAAILVDDARSLGFQRRSPVYLTNLAAALLKLEQFETAETKAHRALELDPTSVKARYRRAMARRALGKLPESLLDLYSLLVTDPGNREARSAYAAVLEIYNLEGKRCLSEIEIFIANAPAAHVSRLTSFPMGTVNDTVGVVLQASSRKPRYRPTVEVTEMIQCGGCECSKPRGEVRFCTLCKRAAYCNQACQRTDWPMHKPVCAPSVERNITLRLSGELLQVELYALRALEFAPHARPRVEGLLNVHVEMVAAPGEFRRSEQRRRLSIREINAAPLDIIPEKDIQQFHEAREEFCAKMGPEVLIVGVVLVDMAEKVVSRTRLCLLAIPPDIVAAARAPNAAVQMYSHSLGKDVLTPVTLENVYGHMEDELRLDTNNYYRMRG